MRGVPLRRQSQACRSLALWAVLGLIALLSAAASATASMTVSGVTVAVRAETRNDAPGTRSYGIAKVTTHTATTDVRTAAGSITSHSVQRPLTGVTTSASDSRLTVSLPRPVNLLIHSNSQPDLLLLAAPPERKTYSASGPGVVYFGPGIHARLRW